MTQRNPSAGAAEIFTAAPTVITHVPASSQRISGRVTGGIGSPRLTIGSPRSASSNPASIGPIISASLCDPITRCHSTSGFATPSHNALTGGTPNRLASFGSAHTIIATPTSSSSRCR